jgi:prophage tail gpP-like protein
MPGFFVRPPTPPPTPPPAPQIPPTPVYTAPVLTGGLDLTSLDNPDLESVSILAGGMEFPHFLAYEYDEHYLTPCAKFWFDLDLDELTDTQRDVLAPGSPVVVMVNGIRQGAGIIDETPIRTGKTGSVLHVDSRDWLSPAVDSQVDPSMQFNATLTVGQLCQQVLAPYGISVLLDSNIANVGVMTNTNRGARSSKTTGKTSKTVLAHQIKPYPREGAFAFSARVCQREGLWLRPGALAGQLIITAPNYDQDPIYQFQHSTSEPSRNNIECGVVTPSRKDQPSIILCYAGGGGGTYPYASLKCAILNPFVTVGPLTSVADNAQALLDRYVTGTKGITIATVPVEYAQSGQPVLSDLYARPLYLEDPESHTMAELQSFARREMSLRMRHSLGIHYDIMGHTLGGVPVTLDTIAAVEDDRSRLHGQFWILGRKFGKSPNGGTTTHAELVVPGSLAF